MDGASIPASISAVIADGGPSSSNYIRKDGPTGGSLVCWWASATLQVRWGLVWIKLSYQGFMKTATLTASEITVAGNTLPLYRPHCKVFMVKINI